MKVVPESDCGQRDRKAEEGGHEVVPEEHPRLEREQMKEEAAVAVGRLKKRLHDHALVEGKQRGGGGGEGERERGRTCMNLAWQPNARTVQMPAASSPNLEGKQRERGVISGY